MATQQNDIKRILAYSTLSQLGYMVMAVGLAAPGAAMFHLSTHAFFKALLFLGAGAVIHALHHEQDIWKMGGLRKKMPLHLLDLHRRHARAHRLSVLRRLLVEGRHPARGLAKQAGQLLFPIALVHRLPHRVLHDAPRSSSPSSASHAAKPRSTATMVPLG